ncbi:IS3 family transposase [Micromonospora echinospora]|uniref:IS3 family transposase n=1 Tax=Micromonospora echinospora TaxID=1877 RepID=UPI003A860741
MSCVNPSARQREDAELAVEIAEIHHVSGGTYGSPPVHAMLRRQGRRFPRRHSRTRQLSFSLSLPVPGNQPSGKPGEPHAEVLALSASRGEQVFH